MSKNKITIISLSSVSILVLALLAYGVMEIRSENNKISEISNQADEASKESAFAVSIRSIKNNSADSINKIEVLSLKNDELVPFIEMIEKTAKDMGLSIETTSVSTDTSKEIQYPAKVHISMKTDGAWQESFNFIYALENLPTKISIDTVSLNLSTLPTEATPSTSATTKSLKIYQNAWHTDIDLTVYIFK